MQGARRERRRRVAVLAVVLLAGLVTGIGSADGRPASAAAGSELRILVIPLRWDNTPVDELGLRDAAFGSSSTSLKTFIEHVSSGRTRVTGQVQPQTKVATADPCSSTWFAKGRLTPPGYDRYIFVTPHVAGDCDGAAGWAHIGGDLIWINGYEYFTYAVRHELGHTLGFWHTLNDDPYDTMGGGCDYQAHYKVMHGWLDNVQTVTANGTYSITASNTANGRVLRIPDPARKRTFWVEVRDWTNPYVWQGQPCKEPPGVVIRAVPDFNPRDTSLVYDGPYGAGGVGYIAAGRTVQLPGTLMQVCVPSLQSGAATVQINLQGLGVCGGPVAVPVLETTPPSVAPGTPPPAGQMALFGQVPTAATISLYANGDCSGTPFATTNPAQFANPGYFAPAPTALTTYSARGQGGCSAPVTIDPNALVRMSDMLVSFTGSPNADTIRVTNYVGGFGGGTEVYIERVDLPITGADGCVNLSANVVRCRPTGVGRVEIHGGGGNDVIETKTRLTSVTVFGDAGNDKITAKFEEGGYPGRVVFYGGPGNDVLHAANGEATLHGEAGNDVLRGGVTKSTIHGGNGDDLIEQPTTKAPDLIQGGAGIDTISYAGRLKSVKVSLDGVANDGIGGERDNVGIDIENVIGGNARDTIATQKTGGIANRIESGPGHDVITTYDGNDSISAGDGRDRIDAGAGIDWIDGGPGADRIVRPEPSDVMINVP